MGPVVGEDGVARCPWGGGPGVMRDYHDTEWGNRVHGESAYLERLTLEAFQSGLSWSTILNKREAFREVFHGFDPEAIAAFGEDDEARLMADARIVRNRAKISAAIVNARATVALREAEGLEALVLSFAPEDPPAPSLDRGDADDLTRVEGALQGAEEARLRLRRPDHDVRADGGDRGLRPAPGRVLPAGSVLLTDLRRAPEPQPGHDRRDPSGVLVVRRAEGPAQVALLEGDPYQRRSPWRRARTAGARRPSTAWPRRPAAALTSAGAGRRRTGRPVCSPSTALGRAAPPGLAQPHQLGWSTAYVAASASAQPAAQSDHRTTAPTPCTCQSCPPNGCHSRNSSARQTDGRQHVRRPLERRGDPSPQPGLHRPCAPSPSAGRRTGAGGPGRMATAAAVATRCGPSTVRGRHDVGQERHRPERDDVEAHPAEGGHEQVGAASGTRHRCSSGGRPAAQPWNYRTSSAAGRDVPGSNLRPRPEAQPQPDPLQVRLGGPLGDVQPLGDLAVGQPLGDQRRHLALTAGQPGRWLRAQPGQPQERAHRRDDRRRRPRRPAGASGPRARPARAPGIAAASARPCSSGAARSSRRCSTRVGARTCPERGSYVELERELQQRHRSGGTRGRALVLREAPGGCPGRRRGRTAR